MISRQTHIKVLEDDCSNVEHTSDHVDITLKVDRSGKRIKYDIIDPSNSWQPIIDGGSIPKQDKESIKNYWEQLSSALHEVVVIPPSSNTIHSNIQYRIEGIGKNIYNNFIPDQLQEVAAQWPRGLTIAISTCEQWIPWELAYDGKDFWGNKFILVRIPRNPDPNQSSDYRRPKLSTSTHLHKAIHIIGGIGDETCRAKSTFTNYNPNTLIKPSLGETIEAIKDADLVHFTCHGYTEPQICLCLGELSQSNTHSLNCLTLTDLDNLAELTNCCVIFANACVSATPVFLLGALCHFGWKFYTKNTAVYIGTLGSVPTRYAIDFGQSFYERFLNGSTVGESLQYAKEKATRENPFRLLYTIYGCPFVRKIVKKVSENC